MMDAASRKEAQLRKLVEARGDVTACVALYLDLYEDTDVMHRDVVEREIGELRDGDEENNMEAGRLELMLRDNPETTYFDYYLEKPITFDWLRWRLKMGADPKKTLNLLRFLQNGNVVRIRNEEEFNRFLEVVQSHGLLSLLPSRGAFKNHTYLATLSLIRREGRHPDWDGKTLYAECQIGKESIGIYPYTVRATVEWYGTEPMSVDDVDDGMPKEAD